MNTSVCVCVGMCVCVCVSVCVSVLSISPKPRVIFTKLVMHVAYRCGSVLLCRGDEIPWGRGNFVFFPFDSALYSIEFGTHTKTAELIEMPFWMVTRVGPANHALYGVHIPQEKGQFLRVVQTIQKH